MNQIEIEIKSFLGSKEKAEELLQNMQKSDPNFKHVSSNKQLNHYFEGGDLEALKEALKDVLESEQYSKLAHIAEHATSFSVRTRWKDGEVFAIVKAALDDTTSENGITRAEFEEKVPVSLDELDEKILSVDFSYQAKWSRERDEYVFRGMNVCIDKNAGYGYLAEFEKVLSPEEDFEAAREEILNTMQELGVEELPQDRLQRMFDFYNQNWRDYYGTDKTFTIE